MTGEEIDINRIYRPAVPRGDKILEVRNLSGRKLNDISFDLHEGEILGFAGFVDTGRSEIMQTIFGYLPEKGGAAICGGRPWKFRDTSNAIKKGVIYLTEEWKTLGILPHLSVRDNIGVLLSKEVSTSDVLRQRKERRIVDRLSENTTSKRRPAK